MNAPNPSSFFEQWYSVARGIGRKFAPVVKRYALDADDCEQLAGILLWKLSVDQKWRTFPDDTVVAYLTVSVRRFILREARKKGVRPFFSLGPVERYEAKQSDALRVFVLDVLDGAPSGIREYLEWRLLGGEMPVIVTRQVRIEASAWLLDQLEGRVQS